MTPTDAARINAGDPQFIADPYPVFAELRAHGALHPHPDWGVRVAVGHEACSTILRHRCFGRLWEDIQPDSQFSAFNRLHRSNMLENEHDHPRLRTALAPLFHRRHLDSLRARIAEIADRYVHALRDRIGAAGSADFMSTLARPLPLEVITELLGFPREDGDMLQTWSNRIVTMYEPGLSETERSAAEDAAHEFYAYATEMLAFRRRQARQDLLSRLAATADRDDSPLNHEELVANTVLLLMAGHEASVNGIANAIVTCHTHPEQWRLLRTQLLGDEAAMATAADEFLRFDTPNQMFQRTATAPVDLGGHRIEPGETVTVLLGAANRDRAAFPDPDTLDLTRAPNPHLALGAGVHYCLGAPLARMELAATLDAAARIMPDFTVIGEPARKPAFAIRGFERLDIA